VREVGPAGSVEASPGPTLAACVATILEIAVDEVPTLGQDDGTTDLGLRRWLGGLGLGPVPVADAASFDWAGPWVAWARPANGGQRCAVVMFGVPSGIAWDPSGVAHGDHALEDGFVISPLDVGLARPPTAAAPIGTGTVTAVFVAPMAGEPARSIERAAALAGRGLEGDRHVTGDGTFPSGVAGSALTLIEAEVCESFDPPLGPDEHRRNVVTRGIDLNALVGHEFTIGALRCRGMRLCEPCTVIDRYADRPVLRALVHRGGLRADILADGEIAVGDQVRSARAATGASG
jgi:MOSC domain-containing protein YiiM